MSSKSSRVGTDILVTCPHCERAALARVAGEISGDEPEDGPPYLLELARCSKCRKPFLAVEEDWGQGWDGEAGVLWPKQQSSLSLHVPEALRREHAEARRCFSAKAYTAAAVMVRRTLEGVCVDQGMSSGTSRSKPLFKMLEQMKDEGKIDGRLLEWAQELRILGNQGAHYTGTSVSREDAADGLALAEALLDFLYVLTAQFAAFKARRTATKAEADGAKGEAADSLAAAGS
ncbi:DUF4145 domain-containing protein [Streptomyces collinus]|uniref:DUF4145 domain-containing protein n=1 Tax=Streptomyces collinus TaxID=42684 RepID=UPI002942A91A|nr:DUF4145 domain-containing protein [Streptomyces collinus]